MTTLETILKAHGLESLLATFESQGIEDSMLGSLSDHDLLTIGVTKLGDRKKLLAAFSTRNPLAPESPRTPQEVARDFGALQKSSSARARLRPPTWSIWAAFAFIVSLIAVEFAIPALSDRIGPLRWLIYDTASPFSPPSERISDIQWSAVDAIYSLRDSNQTDLQKDEAWKHFKGKKIKWSGRVSDIREGLGSLSLQVKMNPSTLVSDLIIFLKDSERSKALKLSEGDTVTFTGVLDSWGTLLPISLIGGVILDFQSSPTYEHRNAIKNERNIRNPNNPLSDVVDRLESSGAPPVVIDAFKQSRDELERALPRR